MQRAMSREWRTGPQFATSSGLARRVQSLVSDAAPASGAPTKLPAPKGKIMFLRILASAVTAGALLAAAPVLAEQSNKEAEPQKHPACGCVAMHSHGQKARADRMPAKESAEESSRAAAQLSAPGADEFRPNPYWNGP